MKITTKAKNNGKSKTGEKKSNKKVSINIEQNDWFYMSPFEVTAVMIADLARDCNVGETEVWEELNILEVVLNDSSGVDFEPIKNSFKDPEDVVFLEERDIKTIFAVTLNQCTLDEFRPFILKLIEKWSGVFCADTYDFNPRIEKKDM